MDGTGQQERARIPALCVHVPFALLVVLAAIHFRERLFADSSYYVINALNSGVPRVEHGRLVLALAELPALIASWLHLPMKAILISYSIGHVLWAWLAATWLFHRARRPELAVGVLLLQLCGTLWLYWSPMLEICYGGWLALLLLAWWQQRPLPRGRQWIAWIMLSVGLISSHPEHFITYLVITLLVWRTAPDRRSVLIPGIAMMLVMALLKKLTLSDYEAGKFGAGYVNFSWRLLDPAYSAELARTIITYWPDVLFLAVAALLLFLRNRQLWNSALLVLAPLCLLVIINASTEANGFGRYIESCYYPIVVIVVMLFALALPDLLRMARPMVLSALVLILLARILALPIIGSRLTARAKNMEMLCAQCAAQGKQKCLVQVGTARPLYGSFEWSLPMEAMLLSSARGPTVNLITVDDLAFDTSYAHLRDDEVLFRCFDRIPLRTLNARLFPVPFSPYSPLDTSAIVTWRAEEGL